MLSPVPRMSAVNGPTNSTSAENPAPASAETGRPAGAARGRPRDASRDAALRQAAMELLGEVGYRALTMDAVSAHARAGEATIYRRWDSTLDLIIDFCHQLVQAQLPVPHTGAPAT